MTHDNVIPMFNVDRTSPGYIAARRQIALENARAVDYMCIYEVCSWRYDPVTKRILSGFGPAGCPCDDADDDSLRLGRVIEK